MKHEFVKFLPEMMEEGIIYISMDYATAAHKCCCGCGQEVVTPFSPSDWKITFNGEAVSLYPSIGNWNFQCRSHYWIKNNRIEWANQWTEKEISDGRISDKYRKKKYYQPKEEVIYDQPALNEKSADNDLSQDKLSVWQQVKGWHILEKVKNTIRRLF